jgi:hypothetical protein
MPVTLNCSGQVMMVSTALPPSNCTISHDLMTGKGFAWLPGVANNARLLYVTVVMRRE